MAIAMALPDFQRETLAARRAETVLEEEQRRLVVKLQNLLSISLVGCEGKF
jgi:hypothetical protein